MGVGDLIFWFLLLVLIKFIFTRIFDLIEYKIKNSNEKKEVTGLCKCLNDICDVQQNDKYESILDEEDLKDLSNDELISFKDIEESDLTNETK